MAHLWWLSDRRAPPPPFLHLATAGVAISDAEVAMHTDTEARRSERTFGELAEPAAEAAGNVASNGLLGMISAKMLLEFGKWQREILGC